MHAELTQNRAELMALVPTRPRMLEGYIAACGQLQDEGRFPTDLPDFTTPDVTSIAYELATDSGAVTTVAVEELLVIAQAYAAINKVRENDLFLTDRNAQIRYNDGEQYLSGFVYYINRASINEPIAIEAIERAMLVLDTRSAER